MDRRRTAVTAPRVTSEAVTQRKDRWTLERERERFLTDVKRFNETRGTPIARWPMIGGRQIDMYELYNNVTERGGWEKVTTEDLWPEVLARLNIPSDCTNADQGLRLIYIRHLHLFERANHFKLDPDVRDDTNDNMDDVPSSARRRGMGGASAAGTNTVCNVALSYNTHQHNLTDFTRDALGLSKVWDKTSSAAGEYSHLDRALASGLPNEVDFAFNISLLLSTASRHTLKGARAVRTVELMLSYVGILKEGEVALSDVWQSGSTLNFLRFWNESTTDRSVKELVCPECLLTEKGSAIQSTEELIREEAEAADDYWLQNLHRAIGMEDKEGQRVVQLITITRNLSCEEDNIELMAASLLIFRFLMLCVHNLYGSIRQNALETLSNISSKIVLEPTDCRMTQLVINTVTRCFVSTDRLQLISGLESLGRLCQLDINEDAICGQLDDASYTHLVRLLTVYDVTILLPALEALYQLSDLGHVCCTHIASVTGAIDVLVDLLTIDAQMYMSGSPLAVKIMEQEEEEVAQHVTSLETFTPLAELTNASMIQRNHLSYFTASQGLVYQTASGVVSMGPGGLIQGGAPGMGIYGAGADGIQSSTNLAVRPVIQYSSTALGVKPQPSTPASTAATPMSSRDVEMSVRRWLGESFELSGDVKSGLTKLELYRHYVAALGAQGASSVLGAAAFESCVRAAFPGLVVKEDSVRMFGGDAVYCGLVQRCDNNSGQGGIQAATGASSYPVRPASVQPMQQRFVLPQGFNNQPPTNQNHLPPVAVRSVSDTSVGPDVRNNCPAIRQVLQGINGAIAQQYGAVNTSASAVQNNVSDSVVSSVGQTVCQPASSTSNRMESNQSIGNEIDNHTSNFKASSDIVASVDCMDVKDSITSNLASSVKFETSSSGSLLDNGGIPSELSIDSATISGNGIPATDILNCALRLAGIEADGDSVIASENDGALSTGSQSVSASTINGVCSPLQMSEVDERDGDRADPKSLDSLPPDELAEEEEALLKAKIVSGVPNGFIKHVNGSRNIAPQDEDSGIACDVNIRKNHSLENGVSGKEDGLRKSNHVNDEKGYEGDEMELSHKNKTMMKEATAMIDGLLREELGLDPQQQIFSNGPVSNAPVNSAQSSNDSAANSTGTNLIPGVPTRFVPPTMICQPAPIQIPAHIQARLSALPVTTGSVLAGLPASFRAAIGQNNVAPNTLLNSASNLSNAAASAQQQQQQLLRGQLLIQGTGVNRVPQPSIAAPAAQQPGIVPLNATRQILTYPPSSGQASSMLSSTSVVAQGQLQVQQQQQLIQGQVQQQQLQGQQLQLQIQQQQIQGQQVQGQLQQVQPHQGQMQQPQQLQMQQYQGQRPIFQAPQQHIYIQRGGQVVQYTAAMSPLVGNLAGGRMISGTVGGMTTPGGIAIVPGSVRPIGMSQITFQPSGTARIPIGQPGSTNHSFIMVHRRPPPGSLVASPVTSVTTAATTSLNDSKPGTPAASGKKRKATTPASAKASKRKKKGGEEEAVGVPASEIEVTRYYCEWAGCERTFETVKQIATHVTKEHFETECGMEKSGVCQWTGCDGLVRQRWSLITHLQDRHLAEHSLRSEAVARIQRSQNTAASVTAKNKNNAAAYTTTANIPPPTTVPTAQPPPATPVMYPQNAALHAIRRFSTRPSLSDFLADESDGAEAPITKHVRLTSGLVLRNLARYSPVGRSLIRKHENHLVSLAFSNLESSSAISSCLWELQEQSQSPH